MRIKGRLALYNTALGSNMYLRRDDKALNRISIRQGMTFLAVTSRSVFPSPASIDNELTNGLVPDLQARKLATLILQVDVAEYKAHAARLTQKQRAIQQSSIIGRNLTASAQLAIEEQISRILDKLNIDSLQQEGASDVRVFGATRIRRPTILPISEVANLTNNRVSFVEEYYGLPENVDTDWVGVGSPGWQMLAGCSMSDAIGARLGLTTDTVQMVINTLKDVIVDTVVKAVPAGITGLTFVVPPLGTIEFQPDMRRGHSPFNIIYHPDENIVSEIASELGFD